MSLVSWFNQFYKYVERSHPSANAQALYLYILHEYNAQRFKGPYDEWCFPSLVSLPSKQIMEAMGWTDRRRLYEARDELSRRRLLKFYPGIGSEATSYEIADEETIKKVMKEDEYRRVQAIFDSIKE